MGIYENVWDFGIFWDLFRHLFKDLFKDLLVLIWDLMYVNTPSAQNGVQ